MKGQSVEPGQPRSLREAVYAINNEQDFKNYILSHEAKVPPRLAEIKYERHPVRILSPTFTPGLSELWLN
jgi:hypothetical protein